MIQEGEVLVSGGDVYHVSTQVFELAIGRRLWGLRILVGVDLDTLVWIQCKISALRPEIKHPEA